jgi:hypothetical protein
MEKDRMINIPESWYRDLLNGAKVDKMEIDERLKDGRENFLNFELEKYFKEHREEILGTDFTKIRKN